jgi:dihydrofolate reductase
MSKPISLILPSSKDDRKLEWDTMVAEAEYFHTLTTQVQSKGKRNALVMSRKTRAVYKPTATPERLLVVLNDDPSSLSNDEWRTKLACAIKALDDDDTIERIFIVGSGEIYSAGIDMKRIQEIETTPVWGDVDTLFPLLSLNDSVTSFSFEMFCK